MINLRYHIVSITAVFLALGIGVAMGATFIDKATVDALSAQLEGLEDSVTATKDENRALDSELEKLNARNDAFEEEGVARLIEDKLVDTPTMILAVRGVNPVAVETAQQRLIEAGSDFAGTLWVDERLDLADDQVLAELVDFYDGMDGDSEGETTIDGAGSDNTDVAGTSPSTSITPEDAKERFVADFASAFLESSQPDPMPDIDVVLLDPSQELAFAVLSAELGLWDENGNPLVQGVPAVKPADGGDDSGGGSGQDASSPDTQTAGSEPTEGQAFIKRLRQLRLLEYEAPDSGERASPVLPAAGVSWIFVSGPGAVVSDESFMYPVIEKMIEPGPAALVVAEAMPGVDSEEDTSEQEDLERGSFVDSLRGNAASANRLSTVDNLDDDLGRVAVVLTTEDLAVPLFGNYGEASSADRLFPPA